MTGWPITVTFDHMDEYRQGIGDSQANRGDHPRRCGGAAAFYLRAPQPSAIPVLVAVPHAGRAYPGSLLERMRHPHFVALRLEDRKIDLLAEEIARQTGAALLVAQAPRAMIDLNRAVDDVDWDMIGGGAPADVGSYTPGMRARSGLGLIPRRLPGLGRIVEAAPRCGRSVGADRRHS